jgi:hypothetical protein
MRALQVRPAQVLPYTTATQTSEIGDLLTAIMPLIMIMMVFMMMMPMFKGMSKGFES